MNREIETKEYGSLIIVDGVFIQNITVYKGGKPIGTTQEKYEIVSGILRKLSEK